MSERVRDWRDHWDLRGPAWNHVKAARLPEAALLLCGIAPVNGRRWIHNAFLERLDLIGEENVWVEIPSPPDVAILIDAIAPNLTTTGAVPDDGLPEYELLEPEGPGRSRTYRYHGLERRPSPDSWQEIAQRTVTSAELDRMQLDPDFARLVRRGLAQVLDDLMVGDPESTTFAPIRGQSVEAQIEGNHWKLSHDEMGLSLIGLFEKLIEPQYKWRPEGIDYWVAFNLPRQEHPDSVQRAFAIVAGRALSINRTGPHSDSGDPDGLRLFTAWTQWPRFIRAGAAFLRQHPSEIAEIPRPVGGPLALLPTVPQPPEPVGAVPQVPEETTGTTPERTSERGASREQLLAVIRALHSMRKQLPGEKGGVARIAKWLEEHSGADRAGLSESSIRRILKEAGALNAEKPEK